MFGLGHRTRESARPAVVRSVGMAAGEFGAAGPRPPHGAGALPADAALGPVPADAQSDADQAITAIYGTEYRSLVRLAAALVGDVGIADEVVQDSFVAMYGVWGRLRDRDKALAYLRRRVINRSRSALRQGMVADGNAPKPKPGIMPSAEQGAITQPEPSAVISVVPGSAAPGQPARQATARATILPPGRAYAPGRAGLQGIHRAVPALHK
jgi:hypothetical protein